MFRLLQSIQLAILLVLGLVGNSQQPTIVVKSFEYTWQKDFGTDAPRIIIPLDDSVKLILKNNFVKAIQNRWNIVMPEVSLSVKPLSIFAPSRKFKTQVKDKEPGKWYLFLQVYENKKFTSYLQEEDTSYTTLELRCKLINGTDDSVIMDRNLMVTLYAPPAPPGQLLLASLPAYPPSFVAGFDSIATWLFQPETNSEKSLRLKPACVFQETAIRDKPIAQLYFKNDNDSIHLLTGPGFTFHTPAPTYEKTSTKKNTGGNIAGGVLTIFTGIGSSKSKSSKYKADYAFEDGDSSYHCLIGYIEEETVNRERVKKDGDAYSTSISDTKVYTKNTDPAFLNRVMLGEDTIATFTIAYPKEAIDEANYTQMWDGSDSATIIALPHGWKNRNEDFSPVVTGKMDGNSFTIKMLKGARIKECYINDQLMAIMQGKDKPVNAYIFKTISSHQLKLFTIFSSLPYAYFYK